MSGAGCRTSGMPTGQGWWWWLTNKPQTGSWPPRRLPSVVRIRRDARVTVTRAIIRSAEPSRASESESVHPFRARLLSARSEELLAPVYDTVMVASAWQFASCELRPRYPRLSTQILADPRLGGPSETPLGKREEVGRQPHQPALRVQWCASQQRRGVACFRCAMYVLGRLW